MSIYTCKFCLKEFKSPITITFKARKSMSKNNTNIESY